jgi:hypothetical protein
MVAAIFLTLQKLGLELETPLDVFDRCVSHRRFDPMQLFAVS